ncbi:T9SS type A sorting domain-containing protein [Flavobacterium sp. UBA7682]|uniref:T9SS type A sorting domain-containing protein n=1 Tax=Flavobacterium sp. UBA7682 TaxID=1946560 RepID=UPI0025B87542|nr:T9SS type A sorting domain-containing protein [Flavobacterium sp. UBA7682]
MRKIYSLLLLAMTSVSFGQTFYSENMGTTASGNPVITAYTGFQNPSPIVYSGTGDMRTSTPSTGYVGASGSVNVFLSDTTDANEYFQIDGLDTSTYIAANLQLKFAYQANYNTTPANAVLIVEYSTNGTTWTSLTYTPNANASWNLITIGGGVIPSSSTLSLRFTQPNLVGAQIRIDDISLSSFDPSCTLVLGIPTTVCDASTLGLDTYTATIHYTGGGSGSYTITPSSGTVSGDNPGSVAEGDIIVSGVAENTALTLSITNGTCPYQSIITSPECKPVNPLPYLESFPYTVGGSLNAEQKWTLVNTGDNITIAAGSLAYPGITASGNSITFVGTGGESRTLFTSTNSGFVYASFIMTASDLTNVTNDLANTYFALFTDNAGATTNARLWIRKNANKYQYGLGTAGSPTAWDPTLYNAGDIQYVVLSYNFTGNTLSLFINPTVGGSAAPTISVTPATAFANLGGFMFRQENANNTPNIIADELRIEVTPNFTLGTQQNEITGLKVYPNPVSNGTLFIETAVNGEKTVIVYDILGKQVLNTTTSDNAINVSNLRDGVYVVKITEEGKTTARKLVIN